jgi:protein transport protein SEC61 subunit gamma-like protein
MISKLKDFISQCYRVWQVTRKPNSAEFKLVSKASALGILAVGFIGFVVAALFKLFFKFA